MSSRTLEHYPDRRGRIGYLSLVVAITIVLYYQAYLAAGVTTALLSSLHMKLAFYVEANVVGYAIGAITAYSTGFTDRVGRAKVVIVGTVFVGLLSLLVMPTADTKLVFALVVVLISASNGMALVATPALVRDFSPQVGRGVAMGFWTIGPAAGSLLVALTTSLQPSSSTWRDDYRIAGGIGLAVGFAALIWLKELSTPLRQQVLVEMTGRAAAERHAADADTERALAGSYNQFVRSRVLLSAVGICALLLIYFLGVGYFPTYFQATVGYSQSRANSIGTWMFSASLASMIFFGWFSDRIGARKPIMFAGGLVAFVCTVLFALRATHPSTSYTTYVVILVVLTLGLSAAYVAWLAAYTETIERRNAARSATGLALYGSVLRVTLVAIAVLVPILVPSLSSLLTQRDVVKAHPTEKAAIQKREVLREKTRPEWQRYFYLAAGGELVFVALIGAVDGPWRPASSKSRERRELQKV